MISLSAMATRASGAHGIMFHHFHNDVVPASQGSLSAGGFERILDFYGSRILPAEEFFERVERREIRPTDVCLTFDDGLRSQVDVALPIMQQRNLTAFWFIYSNAFSKPSHDLEMYRAFRHEKFGDMNTFYASFENEVMRSLYRNVSIEALASDRARNHLSQYTFYTERDRRFRFLRDLVLGPAAYCEIMGRMMTTAKFDPNSVAGRLWCTGPELQRLTDGGHIVGLHSYSHPTRISDLDEREQREEYRRNAADIRAIVGRDPLTMSHPCNSYSDITLAVLADLGVKLGFRADMSKLDGGALEVPREDHANLIERLEA
jgi:peptidoglycan/xylan/chitin deacetylase (PgdA/CDA1 family)